jgi:hypothetical protein
MAAFSLMNLVRRTPSYLGGADVLRFLVQEEEYSTLSVETLKELLRVVGLKVVGRKHELVAELRLRTKEIIASPLRHQDLIAEASARGWPMLGFSYSDLRVLLEYDSVTSAGHHYFPPTHSSPLATILLQTGVGSYQRLVRLQQSTEAMGEWRSYYPVLSGHEDPLYQALWSSASRLAPDQLAQGVVVLPSLQEPLARLLHQTLPDSILRKRGLLSYDPSLLQEFCRRYRVQEEELFTVAVILRTSVEGVSPPLELSETLMTTSPHTLERYVRVQHLPHYSNGLALQQACAFPRIEVQLPQQLPDYTPLELEGLETTTLATLSVREGLELELTSVAREELIEHLTLVYFAPSFQPATRTLVLQSNQEQTTLFTPLEEVPLPELYAFGLRDGTGPLVFFEREELRSTFATYHEFRNPYNNEQFSLTAIRRLIVLATNDDSVEGATFRLQLQRQLQVALATGQREEEILGELQKEDREEVHSTLLEIFELGMTLRGWSGGTEEYPLTAEATKGKGEDVGCLTRSTEELFRVEEILVTSKNPLFLSLPLKNFRRAGFYSPFDSEEGVVLKERFAIVKQGDGPEAPMTSCLRLSSAWFLFTSSYWYWKLTGEWLAGVEPSSVEFIS